MKIEKKSAEPLGDVLQAYIRAMRLGASHNTMRIFEAWDRASDAAGFTLKKFFRDGVLHVTVSSSVVRMQLQMQSDLLVARINQILSEDPLFIKDEGTVGFVKEIRLK